MPTLLERSNDIWQLFDTSNSYTDKTLFFKFDGTPQSVPNAETSVNYTYIFATEIREGLLSTLIKVTPAPMTTALVKIGGFFSFFSFVRFLLSYLHGR